MDEQRLERALRQGPPFATRYIPSPVALDDPAVVRGYVGVGRLVLLIAATGLLLAGMLAIALGSMHDDGALATNGWVAFVRAGSGPPGPNGWAERDIYLVQEGVPAHQIVGSDDEVMDQICPAFSPDGRRLAHGEAEGTFDTGYRDAALVISDVDEEGSVAESRRIDVGGTFPPPCAVWSADGRRVAFGVPLTDPGNPTRTAVGSQVWVASVDGGQVVVLPDLLATDLEWSPDGSELAIASGHTEMNEGGSLRDGSLHVYDAERDVMRTLVGPSGVASLSWAPDGTRIVYQRGASDGDSADQEIWVVAVDGSGELRIASGFGSIYGVGPVWSPTGDHIVYQQMKHGGTEAHHVVLVTPDGQDEVVLPDLRLPDDDPSVDRRPDSVTWSPDGNSLLYSGWVSGRTGRYLIARPLAPGTEPTLIQEGVDPSGVNRSWGRLPDG